jgi:catechol 2,3-dioxygenase-like lactoylglutathione lyase family enzyme
MRIWTLGAKVSDVDAEIRFVEAVGGELLIDDRIPYDGRVIRVPLLRWGDKYLHIADEMVYEARLDTPLPNGLCHVVFEVDDLEAARVRAVAAGAREIAPVARIRAGFGARDVAFLRSPGGTLFELVHILEAAVPSP